MWKPLIRMPMNVPSAPAFRRPNLRFANYNVPMRYWLIRLVIQKQYVADILSGCFVCSFVCRFLLVCKRVVVASECACASTHLDMSHKLLYDIIYLTLPFLWTVDPFLLKMFWYATSILGKSIITKSTLFCNHDDDLLRYMGNLTIWFTFVQFEILARGDKYGDHWLVYFRNDAL